MNRVCWFDVKKKSLGFSWHKRSNVIVCFWWLEVPPHLASLKRYVLAIFFLSFATHTHTQQELERQQDPKFKTMSPGRLQ